MTATKLAFRSTPAPVSVAPSFLDGREAEDLEHAVSEKIRERARLLFEQAGAVPGNDEANWLRAESEILRNNLQVRESGTWVAISGSVPDASGQDVKIVVRPTRVLVCATPVENAGAVLLAANLPVAVDPPTAAASFRDRYLRLMIKKRSL